MPQYEFQAPLTLERIHKILSEHPAFSNQMVSLSAATITLNADQHDGRTLLLARAAGVTVTLPTSVGRGAKFSIKVGTLATSNSHIIKVGNSTDIMQGMVQMIDSDTAGTTTGFVTAADSDTITLNRTTTGSVTRGEWIEIEDTAKGVYTVRGVLTNSGDGATPFSAGV